MTNGIQNTNTQNSTYWEYKIQARADLVYVQDLLHPESWIDGLWLCPQMVTSHGLGLLPCHLWQYTIPGSTCGFPRAIGVTPKHRARNNLREPQHVTPKSKKGKEKEENSMELLCNALRPFVPEPDSWPGYLWISSLCSIGFQHLNFVGHEHFLPSTKVTYNLGVDLIVIQRSSELILGSFEYLTPVGPL